MSMDEYDNPTERQLAYLEAKERIFTFSETTFAITVMCIAGFAALPFYEFPIYALGVWIVTGIIGCVILNKIKVIQDEKFQYEYKKKFNELMLRKRALEKEGDS
jgi:predicted RND superfamily exporter protein